MQDYKKRFIELAIQTGALRFGEFTLKSGRISPYFFNTGDFKTGSSLSRLASYYAAAFVENVHEENVVLFGPAYKGIPLVALAAAKLAHEHGVDLPICYNRKEVKDHGESGSIVGEQPQSHHNIVVIEDVITAGTALAETREILEQHGNPTLHSTIVALDRCEVKTEGASETALQEIARTQNVKIFPIVSIYEIAEYLGGKEKEMIETYLAKYGAKSS